MQPELPLSDKFLIEIAPALYLDEPATENGAYRWMSSTSGIEFVNDFCNSLSLERVSKHSGAHQMDPDQPYVLVFTRENQKQVLSATPDQIPLLPRMVLRWVKWPLDTKDILKGVVDYIYKKLLPQAIDAHMLEHLNSVLASTVQTEEVTSGLSVLIDMLGVKGYTDFKAWCYTFKVGQTRKPHLHMLLHGPGGTGKSTIAAACMKALGPAALAVPNLKQLYSELNINRGGKRLLVLNELKIITPDKKDEFKEFLSSDTEDFNPKFKPMYSVESRFSLIATSNTHPETLFAAYQGEDANDRRWVTIEVPHRPQTKDAHLAEKLVPAIRYLIATADEEAYNTLEEERSNTSLSSHPLAAYMEQYFINDATQRMKLQDIKKVLREKKVEYRNMEYLQANEVITMLRSMGWKVTEGKRLQGSRTIEGIRIAPHRSMLR